MELDPISRWLTDDANYRVTAVRCLGCGRYWVRAVLRGVWVGEIAEWLCPGGWGGHCNAHGNRFTVVNRPELITVFRLTGRLGYGDMQGHDETSR